MKKTKFIICLIVLLPSIIFAQDLPAENQDAAQAAATPTGNCGISDNAAQAVDTSGFKECLIDFNVLSQGEPNDFLALENWNVRLNSSSEYLYDKRFTYSKPAQSANGKSFLGVRIHFPNIEANSYGVVAPRYSLSFYNPETGRVENSAGRGVITNVSSIRSAHIRIAGRNYPHKVIANIVRNTGKEIDMDFGSLLFAGWKTLRWENPGYLADFRDRQTFITPLYPRLVPSIRFKNLAVFRHQYNQPGNFISYVDWINITFDKFFAQEELDVINNEEDFINDEEIWKIIQRESGGSEGKLLKERINNYRQLERLERLKMNLPPEGELPQGDENIVPPAPLRQ